MDLFPMRYVKESTFHLNAQLSNLPRVVYVGPLTIHESSASIFQQRLQPGDCQSLNFLKLLLHIVDIPLRLAPSGIVPFAFLITKGRVHSCRSTHHQSVACGHLVLKCAH